MADKPTQLLLDALSAAAAADPAGLPLYKSKAEPGLFPATAAGKPLAQKALADGLFALVPATGLRPGREIAAATPKGLEFLAGHASPKQVLEDFVRAVERREADVRNLAAETGRLADAFAGLKSTLAAVLPRVTADRVSVNGYHPQEFAGMPVTATAPPRTAVDLAGPVLARLSDWAASAAAGQDCPLPDLFRSLSTLEEPPTIGTFHDCLRALCNGRRVYLHPWTGPLYTLPEPEYALLSGHNVAYYASGRG